MVERPRVLYNEASRAFVMWVHVDEADYELARMGIASARRPEVRGTARRGAASETLSENPKP